jgi:hypothetical protein
MRDVEARTESGAAWGSEGRRVVGRDGVVVDRQPVANERNVIAEIETAIAFARIFVGGLEEVARGAVLETFPRGGNHARAFEAGPGTHAENSVVDEAEREGVREVRASVVIRNDETGGDSRERDNPVGVFQAELSGAGPYGVLVAD